MQWLELTIQTASAGIEFVAAQLTVLGLSLIHIFLGLSDSLAPGQVLGCIRFLADYKVPIIQLA